MKKPLVRKDKEEGWVRSRWRPAMGWTYISINIFDFIIGPIGWVSIQYHSGMESFEQWIPLTLASGGLFHMAMGAVLGVAAWSRGKEKMVGVSGDYYVDSTFGGVSTMDNPMMTRPGGRNAYGHEMSYESQTPTEFHSRETDDIDGDGRQY